MEKAKYLIYNFYILRRKSTADITEGHVQGYIFDEEDTRYIFIDGSNERTDWFYNFWFRFMRTPYKESGTNRKIKVHRGFYKSYLLIREKVQAYAVGQKNVVVVGYSFGGAVATLAALDIQYNNPEINISCITLGSPRVGNWEFKRSYEKRVPNTKRFVNGADIATQVPFRFLGFRHVDEEIHLNARKGFSVEDHYYRSYAKSLKNFA